MSRHLTTVVWHDLIEDPSDLPAESGYGYILSIQYKRSGMRMIFRDVKYDAYDREWLNEDVTTGIDFPLVNMPFVIIAWAEDLKPYKR